MSNAISRRQWLRGVTLSGAAASMAPLGAFASPSEETPAGSLRFVHLADIHVQPEREATRGLIRCLEAVEALDPKPDFILTGGDLIMDAFAQDAARSTLLFQLYRKILADHTDIPVRQCIGNHDVFGWANKHGVTPDTPRYGKKMVCEMLDLERTYYTFDHGGWRFFVLDDIQPTDSGGYQAFIDPEQKDWLKEQLARKDPTMPAAVVCHIPILTVTVFDHGGAFHDGEHHVSRGVMCSDAHELIHLLAEHNVRLAMSGHMHMLDRIDYRGVTFVCEGAVSGAWWRGAHRGFAEGFGLFDVTSDGQVQHSYHTYGWNAVADVGPAVRAIA